MTQLRSLWFATALAFLGCASPPRATDSSTPEPAQQQAADAWMVAQVRDAAIVNAVVAQHTLFPYHFVANGDQLNELGARDLAVLAAHFRAQPGALSVRRGAAPEELYAARVQTVRKMLADAGVDAARLTLHDAPAGGSGMSSERVVQILALEARTTDASAGGGKVQGTNAAVMQPEAKP